MVYTIPSLLLILSTSKMTKSHPPLLLSFPIDILSMLYYNIHMIKVSHIFPDSFTESNTEYDIFDNYTIKSLQVHTYKKGICTPKSYTKTSERFIYVLKGELTISFQDKDGVSKLLDFRAVENTLLVIPANVVISFVTNKDTTIITGGQLSSGNGDSDLDKQLV